MPDSGCPRNKWQHCKQSMQCNSRVFWVPLTASFCTVSHNSYKIWTGEEYLEFLPLEFSPRCFACHFETFLTADSKEYQYIITKTNEKCHPDMNRFFCYSNFLPALKSWGKPWVVVVIAVNTFFLGQVMPEKPTNWSATVQRGNIRVMRCFPALFKNNF